MVSILSQGSNVSPLIMQGERSECALACLAMILCALGRETSLIELRLRFPPSAKGTSLGELIGISAQLGLLGRAVKIDLNEIAMLATPCILHWRLNHFVVLTKFKNGTVWLNDPADGSKKLSLSELGSSFTGVALELSETENFSRKKKSDLEPLSWWRFAREVSGFKRALARLIVLTLLLELVGLAYPIFFRALLDYVFPSRYEWGILIIGGIFCLLGIAAGAISGLRGWLGESLNAELGHQWRISLFKHLIALPGRYFEQRSTGDLLSRFNSIGSIQNVVIRGSVSAALEVILSALTMALILFINKVLFFSSILVVVLIVLIRLLYFKKVVDLNKASIESYARQQSRLIEAVRSSETIKLSGGSGAVVGRFASACGDHLRTCRETARVEAVSLGMSTLISNAERVVVLGLGAYLALEGALSVGGLVAISAYGLQLTSRVSRLCDFAVQARVLSVDGNRVSDIVCSEPEKFLYGEHAAPVHVAEVSLNSVSFRYTANDAWVLKDVNFNAGPTEMTIILGVSGSGKTTFIKVLAGLLDPSSGTVGYSGVDVCNMGKTRYRELVQTVLQDGGIFTGTIADNISMFDPDADLDRIVEAARLACLDEDVAKLPMGYLTKVSPLGAPLSAGQRQRLTIARALYAKPKVLILDEATCHLDSSIEAKVLDNVRSLGITTVLVTHRTELVKRADRVFYLSSGRLERVETSLREGVALSY